MNERILIIQGSARSSGHTYDMCQILQSHVKADFIDLKALNFGDFDYDFKNRNDDFLPLIRRFVKDYDTIILASPIYWYNVSSIMKRFLDRLSDCLIVEKDLGRGLKGKSMAVLFCGPSDTDYPYIFGPLEATAAYLGMRFVGGVQVWKGEGEDIDASVISRLESFAQDISNQTKT